MGRIDLVAIIVSAILLGYIVESVRRRRLREEYSILWLATATVLLLLALIRPALDILARALGIISPVNALFLVGFTFTTIILLHFSTVVSRLSRENRELAQRYALLVYHLNEKGAIQRDPESEKEPATQHLAPGGHAPAHDESSARQEDQSSDPIAGSWGKSEQ